MPLWARSALRCGGLPTMSDSYVPEDAVEFPALVQELEFAGEINSIFWNNNCTPEDDSGR